MTLFCAAICLAGTFTGHSRHLDTGAVHFSILFWHFQYRVLFKDGPSNKRTNEEANSISEIVLFYFSFYLDVFLVFE